MVGQIKNKEIFIPILLGVVFSTLYNIFPLKYLYLGVIGLIGVVLVLYNIKLGLMAGVFMLPFLPDMLSLLFMFFLVAAFFYRETFKENTPLTQSPIDMPIILFGIIIVISTITSINPAGSLRDLALHSGGLSFYLSW